MKKVAILGFGTVGSGVYEMLCQNKENVAKTVGEDVSVKYILDIRDFSDREDAHIFTKNFDDILNDSEVSVVAEVIGGINPAYDFTKRALEKGKSVVTSNKELVATKGLELLEIARRNKVNYLFEASVGGGIPVIAPIHDCLMQNEIKEVGGILNGTTNYILTEMFEKGRDFSEALAEAQELGYAERNPEADVEGYDACRKIAILMSMITGKFLDSAYIKTKGITDIDKVDVAYAEKLDSVIKLVAYGRNTEEGLYAHVSPALVKKDDPLASVRSVFNAVYAVGNAVGKVMFYGRGAGKMPTASAVVSDILTLLKDNSDRGYFWEDKKDAYMPFCKAYESYLVRIDAKEKEKVLTKFSDVSFIKLPEKEDELAFISPVMRNGDLKDALSEINVIKKIRVFGADE